MRAIHCFDNLHSANLTWLNSANVELLPKKEGAEGITDYRPISLMHVVRTIIVKVLANRLGPLISNAQSAFIKRRCIHVSFMYVKGLSQKLHKSKVSALLFKLDIRNAFESVRW